MLHVDWKLCLKHISYLKQKLWASWKMCALPAPAVPHPLPSPAPALTGFLLSVSSLLLPRPAAFPLLPQVHGPADLEELVKEIMRKKWYYSIVPQGPSAAHQCWWGTEMGCVPVCCALAPQAIQEVRRSSFWFSSVRFVCVPTLDFNFCLGAFHRTAELL